MVTLVDTVLMHCGFIKRSASAALFLYLVCLLAKNCEILMDA